MTEDAHDRMVLGQLAKLDATMTAVASDVSGLKVSMAVMQERTGRIDAIEARVRTGEAEIQQLKTGGAFAGKGILIVVGLGVSLLTAAIVAFVTYVLRRP